MTSDAMRPKGMWLAAALAFGMGLFGATGEAEATESLAFKQAIAEGATRDRAVAEFYKARDYDPIWTGRDDAARRKALLQALETAGDHGLPVSRYDVDALDALFRSAKDDRSRGRAEVAASRMFLDFAEDLQTGILTPGQVIPDIKRQPQRRDRQAQLDAFAQSSPRAYLRALQPKSPEYNALLAEKLRLERVLGKGGWGDSVPGKKIEPGESGAQVVALRNRLIAMGYLRRSATQTYDADIQKAVQAFQADHGLFTDGVAGAGTLAELNAPVEKRLEQVIVAMERERWMPAERGKRHVLVNITDFHARIIAGGKVEFQTRSVVGANDKDRRTPEFSDVMEHMIINPTWNVPRSIATKEYLPMLKEDPSAVRHLKLIDQRGQVVSREGMDFSEYTTANFPFDMKQPPSNSNALGLVKFMFPNPHNIYLHDTPAKSLFGRETRAFSHGCIRLNDPFDFAYALLARQTNDPEGYFHSVLRTGRETQVNLQEPLPVHIIYRTALTGPKGRVEFRRDIYGRDARIFDELAKAGVVLRAVRG
ncbi:L,D-transpeptidase family protein [Actibacterium sp. XHP0104]|uniref:L,D-transpeptidase family protein n=1 Tax=Actibacterium sp. XHP0104 TaxID=2984335 RepID=UPI002980BB40|nr:L,D-transpeptidase family protein [Actibacterium sp. XHP0104]